MAKGYDVSYERVPATGLSGGGSTGGGAVYVHPNSPNVRHVTDEQMRVWNKIKDLLNESGLLDVAYARRSGESDLAARALESDHSAWSYEVDEDSPFRSAVAMKGREERIDGEWSFEQLLGLVRGWATEGSTAGVGGSGGLLGLDGGGRAKLETDDLLVRGQLTVLEMIVQRMRYQGGVSVWSAGAMVVSAVVDGGSYWRLFFEGAGGDVKQEFVVDDQARCMMYSGGVESKHYWARVTSVGADWIHLSKGDKVGSSVPAVGDHVVQFGNRTNGQRRSVIVLSSVGGDAPSLSMYDGIDGFSVEGKRVAFLGKGDDGRMTVVVERGEFRGVTIGGGSSGLANLEEWAGAAQDIQAAQSAAAEAKRLAQEEEQARIGAIGAVNASLGSLQDQVDGVVENWYFEPEPTTGNYPANTWEAMVAKRNHVGDTYTSIAQAPAPQAGKSWRWVESSPGVFGWIPISDSDAVKALQEAAKAKATADGKSTTFLVQPSQYSVGDMWVLSSDWNGFNQGDMLTANVGRDNFVASDWGKMVRYTDDTAVHNIQIGGVNTYGSKTFISNVGVDAEVFYQESNGFIVFMDNDSYNIGNQFQKRLNQTITSNGWWTCCFNCMIYSDIWSDYDSYLVVDICDSGDEIFRFDSNNQTIKITKSVYVANHSEDIYNFVDILFYSDQQDANNLLNNVIFVIADLKIEAGNKPTAWTPSIEDTAEGIADAKQAGETAQSTANNAKYAIDAMNNDSIFDLVEKQTIRTQWEKISGVANTSANHGTNGSYYKALTEVGKVSSLVSFRNALNAAYNALRANLGTNELYSNTNKSGFNRPNMALAFANYGNAEVACYNAIQEYYSSLAQQTADTATIPQVVVETSTDQVLRGEGFAPGTLSARRVLKVGDRREVLDNQAIDTSFKSITSISAIVNDGIGVGSIKAKSPKTKVVLCCTVTYYRVSQNKSGEINFALQTPVTEYLGQLDTLPSSPNEEVKTILFYKETSYISGIWGGSEPIEIGKYYEMGIRIDNATIHSGGYINISNVKVIDVPIGFSERNYLLGTSDLSTWSISNNSGDAEVVYRGTEVEIRTCDQSFNDAVWFFKDVDVEENSDYCITFEARSENLYRAEVFLIAADHSSFPLSNKRFIPPADWQEYSYSVRIPNGFNRNGQTHGLVRFDNDGVIKPGVAILGIRNIRLNKVGKHPWQPAPEDATLKLNGAVYAPNTSITIANDPKDNYTFTAEWNGEASSRTVPVVSGKEAWAKAQEATAKVKGLEYLKEAYSEDTKIEGGVIQNSVTLMQDRDGKVTCLINGDPGRFDAVAFAAGIAGFNTAGETRNLQIFHNGKLVAKEAEIEGNIKVSGISSIIWKDAYDASNDWVIDSSKYSHIMAGHNANYTVNDNAFVGTILKIYFMPGMSRLPSDVFRFPSGFVDVNDADNSMMNNVYSYLSSNSIQRGCYVELLRVDQYSYKWVLISKSRYTNMY